jgi:tetratricopeptide (TPR) repeat protein
MQEARMTTFSALRVPALASVLVLAAVLLGGATERFAQAIVITMAGVLLLVAPAPALPGRSWCMAVLGLLALGMSGLLPLDWFRVPSWRATVGGAGIVLPATLSPQPRLTLEAYFLLTAGIVWLGWLLASPWNAETRLLGARSFVCGVTVLAVLILIQWFTGWRMSSWMGEGGLGPFPNRNHTSHVLALGGVLAVGCGADAARRSKVRAVPWILFAAVILAALAASYSRGGVLMFFGALGLWNAAVAWNRRSWKTMLLGAAALVLAASGVLVWGGPIAERFAGGSSVTGDFRLRIWADTLALISASPWCGAGLGNFQALFPFFRAQSITQSVVLHPESDWLWLVTEVGWIGAALALLATGIALAGVLPLERKSQRRIRSAAAAAAVAAVIHGFVDVSGHRLGAVLAATYVLVLARRDPAEAGVSRFAPGIWRALGLALVAGAAWWINVPDDAARSEELAGRGKFAEAAARATRAVQRAPLAWRPYFTRAGALANTGKIVEAAADFRRARLLEPQFVAVPMAEGMFWARTQPELALAAWGEALERADGLSVAGHYSAMLGSRPDDAAFRARLLELAEGRPMLQIDWFLRAPAAEAKARIDDLAPIAAKCDEKRQSAFERRARELDPNFVPRARPPGMSR